MNSLACLLKKFRKPAIFGTTAPVALLALAVFLTATPSTSHAVDAVADKMDQIYQIEKLKARYFRLMDQKKWSEWGEVFTNDAVVKTTAFGLPVIWIGKAQIVAQNSSTLQDVLSVHHGHMPEIEITSATTATGIWAMEDYLVFAGALELQGGGHYYETYVKENGKWKIKSLELKRLRETIGTTATN
jgi:hypothetical protein